MGKLRIDNKKPSIRLGDTDYILTWSLFNLKVVFPRTGFMTGDIVPCEVTPHAIINVKSKLVDIKKLQWDVLQLVGLFSEKEIVTMVQALHPAATSTEIIVILKPGYKQLSDVVSCVVTREPAIISNNMLIEGGMRLGKTMAVNDSMDADRDMESKPKMDYIQFFKDIKYATCYYFSIDNLARGLVRLHPLISFDEAVEYVNFYEDYCHKFEQAYNEADSIYTLAEMFFRPEMKELVEQTCNRHPLVPNSVTITDVNKFKITYPPTMGEKLSLPEKSVTININDDEFF